MSLKQSVLLVGVNYSPEPVGIGPYTTGLAEALASAGYDVKVVAGQPYYPQWKRFSGFGPLWTSTRESGVEIVRCPHYVPERPSGLRRVLHLATFAAAALLPSLATAFRRRPAVVIVVAPALLSVPVAWLAAKLARAKLWIHVQDFEVDAAVATGLVNGGGALLKLARAFERLILRSADRVSTISPQMCAKLVDKGVSPDRILEARNWANREYGESSDGGLEYREQWGLSDKKVALYSGNIANKQGIEIIIQAAKLTLHRSDIVYVICGEGPNRANLEKLSSGMPNVQLHDLQPSSKVSNLLALAAVHLLPQIPDAADLVLPSKLANMLGSGRPVVATAAPGTGIAVEVEGAGLVTAPGDHAALAEAVLYLVDHPDIAEAMGETGRLRALDKWSRPSLLGQMVASVPQLLAFRQ